MSDDGLCRLLGWDTEFFGFPIGRMEPHRLTATSLEKAAEWCTRHGIRCLYALVDCDDPDTLREAKRYGLDLIDIRVTLRRHGKTPLAEHPMTGDIRESRREDISGLTALAAGLFRDSRFNQDDRFPRDRAAALYAEWVRKSCERPEGKVFVAGPTGQPTGLVTCDPVVAGMGHIGLCGVHASARQRGLGTRLMQSALVWYAQQETEGVDVVTQGRNIAAQQLYQRCGFLTHSIHLWYHWWFSSSKGGAYERLQDTVQ
jgi:dTDP-4-amino-4,6-dideoxy-D-galactose acyltransferase